MSAPAAPVTAAEVDVNSLAFWDARFARSWQVDHGPEQTRFFGELALATLPLWLRQHIQQRRLTVCDWGCALGEGTALLARGLGTRVTGVDFSATAIDKAKTEHPGLAFVCEDWLAQDVGDVYDLVFSSNTLEHFEQPWRVFARLAQHARCHVVLLLPFREPVESRYFEHCVSFEPANVPFSPAPGWCLVDAVISDLGPSPFWSGEQVLLVYSRSEALAALGLSDGQCSASRLAAPLPEADTVSAALAEAHRQRDTHAAAIQLLLAENRELRACQPVAAPGPAARAAQWVRRLFVGRGRP
jgi:SAM-dependent methyltransferase